MDGGRPLVHLPFPSLPTAPMPHASDRPSVSDRLLDMAQMFAQQGRPAMAEAARRAAVRPSPPLAWRSPAEPLDDEPDASPASYGAVTPSARRR